MGILDRALRKGINQAVGRVVEQTVAKTVAPVAERVANRAAEELNQATGSIAQATNEARTQQRVNTQAAAASFGGAFASLQNAAMGFANEAAKNMKICESCGQPAGAEQKFCPACGAQLPEQTLAQGAVCASCGAQNSVGTRFCAGCGAKLPQALAEDARKQADNDAVMAKWDAVLPQYPKWCFGGETFELTENGIDENGYPCYWFCVSGTDSSRLRAYRELLKQNGFRPAGEYPSEDMLYRRVGGLCYYFESCEPFPGDPGDLSVSFGVGEPHGGFDYVKPEPRHPATLKDLKGLFKL